MASLNGMYDENAEPSAGFDPFPEGEYFLQLTESDIVPTGNGEGQGFKFKAEVTQGDHKGRFVFGFINLANKSTQAQEIGQREFSALRHATGVLNPEDTQDLHYKEFKAKVGIKPPSKGKDGKEYSAANVIKKYFFEGDDSVPEGKSEAQPANDNKAAANDNKPVPAAKRPWTSKK